MKDDIKQNYKIVKKAIINNLKKNGFSKSKSCYTKNINDIICVAGIQTSVYGDGQMFLNIGIWIPSFAPYPIGTTVHQCNMYFRADSLPAMEELRKSSGISFDYYLCPEDAYDFKVQVEKTQEKKLARLQEIFDSVLFPEMNNFSVAYFLSFKLPRWFGVLPQYPEVYDLFCGPQWRKS